MFGKTSRLGNSPIWDDFQVTESIYNRMSSLVIECEKHKW